MRISVKAARLFVVAALAASGPSLQASPHPLACPVSAHIQLDHVRPLGGLRRALDEGLNRSASLRGLVERLESLDGLVYLRSGPLLRSDGQLLLGSTSTDISIAGTHRVVKVTVAGSSSNGVIKTIAHELQHVLEILETPEARNRVTVEQLFKRIGFTVGPGVYETTAALATGDQVFRELSKCSGLVAMASQP